MVRLDHNPQRPFRVIIVGAGLVGLSLSHALQLANIDHVVLEKHKEVVSVHGAALMIYPGTSRVFDQFGILKKIQDSIMPIQNEVQRWPDGSLNFRAKNLQVMSDAFDMPVILFDRQKCARYLYEGLPDKSRIRTNALVESIQHTECGVKVFLKNGTFEEGDLVIGADGVHSLTRQLMWDYAAENEPETIPHPDKKAIFTEFKGFFGVSNRGDLSDLGDADVHTIYGEGVTKLLFTQPGVVYWCITFKDKYSQPPKTYRPTQDEQEAVAERLKDLKMTENLTFGDLWKNRTRSGVLNIEEGILKSWHAGRIVLVGDSAHKMTADLGLGANVAIESAITLCNLLHRSISSNPEINRHLTQSQLTSLFAEYQSERYSRAKRFMDLSGSLTRMRSHSGFWGYLFITRIVPLPWLQRYQIYRFMKGWAMAPKLEYVDTRTINEHAAGWKMADKDTGSGSLISWLVYAIFTSVVGVVVWYVLMMRSRFGL